MPRAKLSISEYTILGLVWRDGPCTTYHVMRQLASSASTFYRNRAGSTYRVVERLIGLGLLTPDGDEIGSRKDRQIIATEKGAEVLRKWLSPPMPRVEVAHTVDLVRLRLFFVGALETEERIALIDDAIGTLKDLLKQQEVVDSKNTDRLDALASLGTIYETRARIEWLEYVKTQLKES